MIVCDRCFCEDTKNNPVITRITTDGLFNETICKQCIEEDDNNPITYR